MQKTALCYAFSAVLVMGTCMAPLSAFAEEPKNKAESTGQSALQTESDPSSDVDSQIASTESEANSTADNELMADASNAETAESQSASNPQQADNASNDLDADQGNVIGSNITDEQIAEALQGIETGSSATARNAISTYSLSGNNVTTYGGATMYETAVAEAKAAYSSSRTVVLAGPEDAWTDALSAAGLAGCLDCPILFTYEGSLHPATRQALKDLGASEVIIVGGPEAISPAVENDLRAAGVSVKARLGGADCYGTQMEIYQYGKDNGLWSGGTAFVATGGWFGDALSASPVAFATKSPIFLSRNGGLDSAQRKAIEAGLKSGEFDSVVMVGGPDAISQATGDSLQKAAQAAGGSFTRLWGAEQYETSVAIAKWAVGTHGFSWDNAAFATGYEPYDALAGSVLQGKGRSVLLLVGPSSSATISAAASNKGAISSLRFFGGTVAIPTSIRNQIVNSLGMNTTYAETGISLSAMAKLEGVSASTIDPSSISTSDSAYYQFAILDQGYSGKITASQIDSFIADNCIYQESNYGVTSTLRGMGSTIIAASKKYNVNEIYLLSHAIIESAWGCSYLATGRVSGYSGYYNFFGIGAYDIDPNNGGAALAKKNGWNTPAKAIEGAAQWISSNYLNNEYDQNTLYKMRWNYAQAASEGAVWHQYATAPTWATGIASVMDNVYRYLGISQYDTGLKFLVPQYS